MSSGLNLTDLLEGKGGGTARADASAPVVPFKYGQDIPSAKPPPTAKAKYEVL